MSLSSLVSLKESAGKLRTDFLLGETLTEEGRAHESLQTTFPQKGRFSLERGKQNRF